MLYALVAGAVLVAALVSGSSIRAQEPEGGAGRADNPYLAAQLNGGDKLTLLAAITKLRAAGLLEGHDKMCWRVGNPALGGRTALERAVLTETESGEKPAALLHAPSVRAGLAELRDQLVGRGLLLSEQHAAIKRRGHWLLAVFVFGLVVAALSNYQSVEYLLLEMALVVVAMLPLYTRAPVRSAAGEGELRRLRNEHERLDPKLRPNWTTYGAAAAAMAVALFGARALWVSDPDLAEEIVAYSADGSNFYFVGGYGGYSGGGDASCGGTSSCGSGSSSCGGGGGGGGCGGGGGGG